MLDQLTAASVHVNLVRQKFQTTGWAYLWIGSLSPGPFWWDNLQR